MIKFLNFTKKNYIHISGVLVFIWTFWLLKASLVQGQRYLVTELFVGVCAMLAIISLKGENECSCMNKREAIWINTASVVLAIATILANYFYIQTGLLRAVLLVVYFVAGYVAYSSIFKWFRFRCGSLQQDECHENLAWKPKNVFLIIFFGIVIIDLIVLFCVCYPGNLSYDSMNQISQVVNGGYSNHHPYYQTLIIKLFVKTGMFLFGNINTGVCLYSIFQIICMAFVFAYTVMTIWQLSESKLITMLCGTWFMFYPVHIMYSFTMWKDVLFSGAVLMFITSLVRYWSKYEQLRIFNFLCMVLSSFVICLFRSNGFIAYILCIVCFAIFFGKKYKNLLVSLCVILICSFILRGPVLDILRIVSSDTVESLSIPVQQIARVVSENGHITDEQMEMLNKVVDVNRIPEEYKPYISDPIKHLVRTTGDQQYITDNKADYLRLWIEIGLQNPDLYIYGWIDQTVGYWYSGHSYWVIEDKVYDNGFGIKRTSNSPIVSAIFKKYTEIFTHEDSASFLKLFVSIGLFVWIVFAIFVIWMSKGKYEQAFLSVPVLTIFLSLLIATPVAYEYRYIYCAFTCMPMIFSVYLSGLPAIEE